MFESSVISVLAADAGVGGLTSYLSTYNSSPAIFSEEAPKQATKPYIVFRITGVLDDDWPGIEIFNIYINYHEYDSGTRLNSRKAAMRIKFLLDQVTLTHPDYDNIRVFFESEGGVEKTDPRKIHYNLQFNARAGRQAWGNYIDP